MDKKSKTRRKRLNAILSVIVSAHMVLSLIPAEALAGIVEQTGMVEQARAGTGDADAALGASTETPSDDASATVGTTEMSEKDAAPSVELKAAVGDARLSLRTPVGTLPEDASLHVGEVGGDLAREVASTVAEVRTSGADEDVRASYAFDVRLEDTEGRELDLAAGTPETELSFSVREVADAGLEARVFRVVEERDVSVREPVRTENVYYLETQGEVQEQNDSGDARHMIATELEVTRDEQAGCVIVDAEVPAFYVLEFVVPEEATVLAGGDSSPPARREATPATPAEDEAGASSEGAGHSGTVEEAAGSTNSVGDREASRIRDGGTTSTDTGDAASVEDGNGDDDGGKDDGDGEQQESAPDEGSLDELEEQGADTSGTGDDTDDEGVDDDGDGEATEGASFESKVTAKSETDNVVGELLANAANEAIELQDADDTTKAEAEAKRQELLEQYPTEHHDEAYYEDSVRMRDVRAKQGADLGYLVYRDSYYIVDEDAAKGFEVSWSEDRLTAFVTPAIDPTLVSGASGIVLLGESIADDEVLVFEEGTDSYVEAGTLVVSIAPTDGLSLNQVFSDGQIRYTYNSGGGSGQAMLRRSLGADAVSPTGETSRDDSLQAALGLTRTLSTQAEGPNVPDGIEVHWPDWATKTDTNGFSPIPYGTNWIAWIDYSKFDFDEPDAHFEVDVWELKFELRVALGVQFDFQIDSMGDSNGRESKDVISFSIPIEGLFSIGFGATFIAKFNEVPVHIEGHTHETLDFVISLFAGPSVQNVMAMIDVTKYEFTDPEEDKNKDSTCFIGSGLFCEGGFIELDLGLFTIGPILSVRMTSWGGTHFTGRLDKDCLDLEKLDRKADSVHLCGANGRGGCYNISTEYETNWNMEVILDLYVKSWSWPSYDYPEYYPGENYYRSLVNGDTGVVKGYCPSRLYRIPVKGVIKSEINATELLPVQGLAVKTDKEIVMPGVSQEEMEALTQDKTAKDGTANLFLPYADGTRYAFVGNGTYQTLAVKGSGRQQSDMKRGLNDEVNVLVANDAHTTVRANMYWDVDRDKMDVPEGINIVVQMRKGPKDTWKDVAYAKVSADAEQMKRQSDSDVGAWEWSHRWPKFTLINNEFVLNEFRVLEMGEMQKADRDYLESEGLTNIESGLFETWYQQLGNQTYYKKDVDDDTWWARDAVQGQEVSLGNYPFGNDPNTSQYYPGMAKGLPLFVERMSVKCDKEPYVTYSVGAYTDSHGLSVGDHKTKYKVTCDTDFKEEIHNAPDGANELFVTSLRHQALADIKVNKIWQLKDKKKIPEEVYLALMYRPYAQWAEDAAERGMPFDWMPVEDPLEGTPTTLRDLMMQKVISYANIYDIERVPFAIAKLPEDGKWNTRYLTVKYPDGIPVQFMAKELDDEILETLLTARFSTKQLTHVMKTWEYTSVPSLAVAEYNDPTYFADVINTDGDPKHTIGGKIFWNVEDESAVHIPPVVTVKVYDTTDGGKKEVGEVDVYQKDFAGSNIWSWTFSDDEIDPSRTYAVDEIISIEYGWVHETSGLDITNRYCYNYQNTYIELKADVVSPPQDSPTGDPLKVEVKGWNGSVWQTELEYDAQAKKFKDGQIKLSADQYGIVSGVELSTVNVTNPGVLSSAGANVITSSTYEGLHYDSFGLRPSYIQPVYTFRITGVVESNPHVKYKVEWGLPHEGGYPTQAQDVIFDLYRDGQVVESVPANITPEKSWDHVSESTYPLIADDGHLYDYTVKPRSELEDFMPSVEMDTSNPDEIVATITYTYLDKRFVSVEGDITWVDDEGHEDLRPKTLGLSIVAQSKDEDKTAHTVKKIEITPVGTDTTTHFKVEGLPRRDSLNTELVYSVLQDEAPGYTTTYDKATYDEDSRTWTCNVTDKLTGFWEMNLVKRIEGVPGAGHEKDPFEFTIEPVTIEPVNAQDGGHVSPEPLTKTVTIEGAGTKKVEFFFTETGVFNYQIKETKGTDESCAYDEVAKNVTIVRSRETDGSIAFTSYVSDDVSGPNDVPFINVMPVNSNWANGTQAITDALQATRTNTVTFTNKYAGIGIEKKWDIDLEKLDKPESIQVLLQQKTGDAWKTVKLITLNDPDWHANAPLPGGNDAGEYRVRELREATVLEELSEKIRDLVNQGKKTYNQWINIAKTEYKAYWDKLPADIRSAAEKGYDALLEKLGATGNDLFDKLMEQLNLACAEDRIVYDKDDADKPGDKDATTNEVTYHVAAHPSAVAGGEEPAHVTKYRVAYDTEKTDDNTTVTITNTAVLEFDVIKRWIAPGVKEEDMPDAAWVVLMCKPKAGALDNAKGIAGKMGLDLSSVLNYEFPVINPLEGGQDPIEILGKLTIGLDLSFIGKLVENVFGIKIPKLAIQRVTAENKWRCKVVDTKYTMGIPMDYKGAELGSEIIRQIVYYLTKGVINSPVSYNPFGNFLSIPTKAIHTILGIEDPEDLIDISGLTGNALKKAESLTMDDIKDFGPRTLLDDWHYMANVINVKFDWDDEEEVPPSYPDDLHGQKTWDDQDDKYGTRPDTIKVYLKVDGMRLKDDDGNDVYAETSAAGRWRYSFAGRPKLTDDGRLITYSVEEEPIKGYASKVDGFNIRNEIKDKVKLTIKKEWDDANDADGMRPKALNFILSADGKDVDTFSMSGPAWNEVDLGEVPLYNKTGAAIKYEVREKDVPQGYTVRVSEVKVSDNQIRFDVLNVHEPDKTSIGVTKVWNDENNKEGKRPDSVTVRLVADGKATGETLTLSASKNWSGTFENLRVFRDKGTRISYRVTEDAVGDYTTKVTGDAASGFTITNTYAPGKTQVVVNKVWDDGDNAHSVRPTYVTVHLLADGEETGKTLTLKESNSWSGTFENLDEKKDDKAIVYTVSEEMDVRSYEDPIITGDAKVGFTITNTRTLLMMNISVIKTWNDEDDKEGKRPDSVTVRLIADGEDTGKTLTLNESNSWTAIFENVPVCRTGGGVIIYNVTEDAVTDYTTTVVQPNVSKFIVRNKYAPGKTQVVVHKVWDDADNAAGKRPASVTVRLLANGEETGKPLKLEASNFWTGTFENLDAEKDGKAITYTVSEDDIGDGYEKPIITGDATRGFIITNKLNSEKTKVSVTKVWDDDDDRDGWRPASVTVSLLADGKKTGATLSLDEGNGWSGTFDNLDRYKGRHTEISYSVEESVLAGYYTTISGSAADGFTITNKRTPVRTKVSVTKYWEDHDNETNQDGKRPESVTVRLRADGVDTGKYLTLSESNNWMGSFDNLLSNRDHGVDIAYTVSEDAVANYTATITGDARTGYIITNTHAPEKTQVSVHKVWDDADDADGKRPHAVTVRLLANGKDTGNAITLDAGDSWKGAFTRLDRYVGGAEIAYTVTEDTVAGYTTTITGDAATGFTITNKYEPVTTKLEVTKEWEDYDNQTNQDGKRPSSVTVRLRADGKATGRILTLSEKDEWKGVFDGLRLYRDHGVAINYTVTEDAVADYTTTIGGDAKAGFTITNKHTPGKTHVSVHKVWEDADDADGKRPTSVTVRLLADGKDSGKRLTLSATGGWSGTFTDLDRYKEGVEIVYTVSEFSQAGYDSMVSGSASTGFTITNKHAPATTKIDVTKEWNDYDNRTNQDGKRPSSVTVRLRADGKATGRTLTLTEKDEWKGTFTDLAVYRDHGVEIKYTVTEDAVADYTTTISGDAKAGFTVINSHEPGKTQISVHKVWDDDMDRDGRRPTFVTVHLLADGIDTGKSIRLTARGDWSNSFAGLDTHSEGKRITYTVSENSVPDYATMISGSASAGFTITNRHVPAKTKVDVTKVWDDRDNQTNQDGKRPSSVTVRLRADGTDTGKVLTLSEANKWMGAFEGLYVNRNHGRKISYTVTEDVVDDYVTSITGEAASGFTITNKHAPDKTHVVVHKVWDDADDVDGIRPASVTVRLLADGKATKSLLTLSEQNSWTGIFEDLERYELYGTEVAYTVTEDDVADYTTTITGSAKAGFTITNTHKPETVDVDVDKVWVDHDDKTNQDGKHPDSVTVRLRADGADTGLTLTLSETNEWKGSFKGQPAHRDHGVEIKYIVSEDVVTDYTATVDGSAKAGFTITNKYEPGKTQVNVFKVWDDYGDRDGKRPHAVTVHLLADGTHTGKTLVLSSANDWWDSFTSLDREKDGKAIAYTVTEDTVADYTTTITGSATVGFTVTNTFTPETVDVDVHKVWDDADDADKIRPASVTVRLFADGTDTGKTLTLSPANGWMGAFRGLDRMKDGKAIAYTVSEDTVVGYTPTITDGASAGFTITNAHVPGTTQVGVRKVWDDADDADKIRPASITVRLLADGTDTGKSLVLSSDNRWSGSFNALEPEKDGKAIAYTVSEDTVVGYTTTIAGDAKAGFTITNAHVPGTTQVGVRKVWNDADDAERLRPASVTVRLMADGTATGKSLSLSSANGWTGSFNALEPEKDGKAITYTVTEDAVAGYETTISGSAAQGFTITNTHRSSAPTVGVQKVWDDMGNADRVRPSSVTVHLYSDGTDTGKSLTLSAATNWRGVFSGLEQGTTVAYTVTEDPVALYTTTVAGNATSGFTVTNTHVPYITPVPLREYCVITYDLNGGTYRGSSANIRETYPLGTQITIHEAPVREGHRFTYWRGSEYRPGERYTVVGDHTFVAQWESEGSPTPVTHVTPTTPATNAGASATQQVAPAAPAARVQMTTATSTPASVVTTGRGALSATADRTTWPVSLASCGAALLVYGVLRVLRRRRRT